MSVTDKIGNEIEVGSYIIYSKRASNILKKVYKNDKLKQGTFIKGVISSIIEGKTIVVEFKHRRYITPKMVIQKMKEYGINSEQFSTYLKTNNISARIKMI